MSWIQTYSGEKFDLLNPTPSMINIQDIAHALSNLCRFTGHVDRFYSVAEHSWRVAGLVPRPLIKQALLHDAAEAYIQDIASPLKALLPEYQMIERRVWWAICDRFNLPYKLDEAVKIADLKMLKRERTDLMGEPPELWHPSIECIDITGVAVIHQPQTSRAAKEALLMQFALQGVK